MAKKDRVVVQVESASVVTFFLGDEECAVPITSVHQIIRDIPITRVPNVNPDVEGVLNLRGMVVPIIDLKHLLGLGTRVVSEQHRLPRNGLTRGMTDDKLASDYNGHCQPDLPNQRPLICPPQLSIPTVPPNHLSMLRFFICNHPTYPSLAVHF